MKIKKLIDYQDLKTFSEYDFDGLEYIYRGQFDKSITDQILSLAEKDLDATGEKDSIKRRIFFIMVEGLQNITRHQDEVENTEDELQGIFIIQRMKDEYIITTGNIIENEHIESLKEKLETINSLEIGELKKHYLTQLRNGRLSDKGGAGLGLIEMARRSGNQLIYDFKPVNDEISFFYFQTTTSFYKKRKDFVKLEAKAGTLNYIKNVHELLNKNKVQIAYKGNFTQASTLNLLNIIERQINRNRLMTKVFNLMIEMLQNIAKHGDNKNENGTPALFYLIEYDKGFSLITANYVNKSGKRKLAEKIDFINRLDNKQLNDYYKNVLLYFEEDEKNTGLGFPDMRLKSGQKINYDFLPFNENFDIFLVHLCINLTDGKMKPLIIKGDEEIPSVKFIPMEGKFSITGRSLPENAVEFYSPILNWLEDYEKEPNLITNVELNFEYFNTASSKQVVKMLLILEKIAKKSDTKILWYYHGYDEDMQQNGIRYASIVDIEFELIEVDDEE